MVVRYWSMRSFGCGIFGFGRWGSFESFGVYVVHCVGLVLSGVSFVGCVRHSMKANVMVISCRHLWIACVIALFIMLWVVVGGCLLCWFCVVFAWYARSFQCCVMYVCVGLCMLYVSCLGVWAMLNICVCCDFICVCGLPSAVLGACDCSMFSMVLVMYGFSMSLIWKPYCASDCIACLMKLWCVLLGSSGIACRRDLRNAVMWLCVLRWTSSSLALPCSCVQNSDLCPWPMYFVGRNIKCFGCVLLCSSVCSLLFAKW